MVVTVLSPDETFTIDLLLLNWNELHVLDWLTDTWSLQQNSLDKIISFISAKKWCIAYQCGWKSHKTVCGFCRMMIVNLAMGTKHHQVLPLLIADLNSRTSWLLRGLYSAWYHLCAFRVKLLWNTHTHIAACKFTIKPLSSLSLDTTTVGN